MSIARHMGVIANYVFGTGQEFFLFPFAQYIRIILKSLLNFDSVEERKLENTQHGSWLPGSGTSKTRKNELKNSQR
jgi:hypothetical protein